MSDTEKAWALLLMLFALAYLLGAPPQPDYDLYVPHH